MRKAYFMVAFLATIIQLRCEQGYPIQKNLNFSKYNGLWNFEVSGNHSFVFREEQSRKVQYRLRFLCQSFHPSYFSFNDTIQFLIREPVLCYEIRDCIGRHRYNNIENAIYIKDGEIRGLNFGNSCEEDIAIVSHRIKYRNYKKELVSYMK